jgi:hypothetical protein
MVNKLMKANGLQITSLDNADSAEIPRDIFFDGSNVDIVVNSTSDITITIENIGSGSLDLNVEGSMILGEASATEASFIEVFDGDVKPGYITLYADDGSPHYLFVETNGKVKMSCTIPEKDSDGEIVGNQDSSEVYCACS